MPSAQPIRLAVHAMATRFEIVLHGSDDVRMRAAGEEAIREIERIEKQLNFHDPCSELGRLNASAATRPQRLEPRLFRLIEQCVELSAATLGAFDVTIAPLMRAWGFVDSGGRIPDSQVLQDALSKLGTGRIVMDASEFTVAFDRAGVEIDLGAVGKGYAIERAAGILRDNGVVSALIHGGTSTVCAIGCSQASTPWRVAVRSPTNASNALSTADLQDSTLSVSAVHGKSFTDCGEEYGHVIDPRSGLPVSRAVLASVTGPSPTVCDALSTALLVLGTDGLPVVASGFPGYEGLIALPDGSVIRSVDP